MDPGGGYCKIWMPGAKDRMICALMSRVLLFLQLARSLNAIITFKDASLEWEVSVPVRTCLVPINVLQENCTMFFFAVVKKSAN